MTLFSGFMISMILILFLNTSLFVAIDLHAPYAIQAMGTELSRVLYTLSLDCKDRLSEMLVVEICIQGMH